jgi:hypothetical protein
MAFLPVPGGTLVSGNGIQTPDKSCDWDAAASCPFKASGVLPACAKACGANANALASIASKQSLGRIEFPHFLRKFVSSGKGRRGNAKF